MTISVDAKKAYEKIQHPFITKQNKTTQQIRKGRKISST